MLTPQGEEPTSDRAVDAPGAPASATGPRFE